MLCYRSMKPKHRHSCRTVESPPSKMKAKRKHSVDDGGGSSPKRKQTNSTCATSDATWCPGAMPDFVPFDHERLCPRYMALVARDPHQDPATVDEVDPLLHEVESMLEHTMAKQRALAEQILKLTGSLPAGITAIDPPKDDTAPKAHILKVAADASTGTATPSRHAVGSKPRSKAATIFRGVNSPCIVAGPDPEVVNVAVPSVDALGRHRVMFCPQNNMPDKFWNFVADHNRPIENSDLQELDSMLEPCSASALAPCYMVPGLAKHYTLRRAASDASHANGTPAGHKAPHGKRSSGVDNNVAGGSRGKVEPVSNGDVSARSPGKAQRSRNGQRAVKQEPVAVKEEPTVNGSCPSGPSTSGNSMGAITERLVHALLEAPQGSASHGGQMTNGLNEYVNGLSAPARALISDLNLAQWGPQLEHRIKCELQHQGFLDAESSEPTDATDPIDEEDEVLCELRQRQAELRSTAARANAIGGTIRHRAQRLHDVCATRSSLREADRKIMELYRRYYSLVPARRPANKKERQALQMALDSRRQILHVLRLKAREGCGE